MKGGAWNGRGFFALLAATAALLVASGCGGSGSDQVTVQTGSLSKTEFVEKADAVCQAAKDELHTKFEGLLRKHKSDLLDKGQEQVIAEELLELLTPYVEAQVNRIGELGAPASFAPQVAAFLNALEERLGEVRQDPTILKKSPYPFTEATDLARKAGLNGCLAS